MRALLFTLMALLATAGVWAQEEVYFQAMADELNRTQKQLKIADSPKPYFTSFWLTSSQGRWHHSSWGELVSSANQEPQAARLVGRIHMVVGDKKENSQGFLHSRYYYAPNEVSGLGNGYDAVRLGFWRLADMEYREMLEIYAQKEAYKRQRQLLDDSADFAPAKQGVFVDSQPAAQPFPAQYYDELVEALSAEAKKYPYLEDATASVLPQQQTHWYLNSQGGKRQVSFLWHLVRLSTQTRNKDGFKQNIETEWFFLDDGLPAKEELVKKASEFYQRASEGYQAKRAEPYIGPVLFKPAAALGLVESLFVKNVSNTKPLLQSEGEDQSAGGFKDKIGQRVFSVGFVVEDKPLLREYNGQRLAGFLPVDDEGVPSENLLLVKNGKLLDLPFSRSLTQGRKKSNGHARMSSRQRPRAGITNLFITPQKTYTQEELEQKLLQRCRELGLEYGYIAEEWPSNPDNLPNITRIYVKDGHKEQVYGAQLKNLTPRSLRDILAAGDDEKTFQIPDSNYPRHSITLPSLLVDEMELAPTNKQPERKPFVPQP